MKMKSQQGMQKFIAHVKMLNFAFQTIKLSFISKFWPIKVIFIPRRLLGKGVRYCHHPDHACVHASVKFW
jgi:hypothetical protein